MAGEMIMVILILIYSFKTYTGNALDNQITSKNLRHLLTDSEWIFFFGSNHQDINFSIANWKVDCRRRRSTDPLSSALQRRLGLQPQPVSALLDPQFVLVRRWGERREPLPGLPHTDDVTDCFFRSDNAALSLCGDVRGIVTSESNDYFFIHPLPERFHTEHTKPHIIVRRSNRNLNDMESNDKLEDIENSPCGESDSHENVNFITSTIRPWTKHRRKNDTLVDITQEFSRETPINISLNEFKYNLRNSKDLDQYIYELDEKSPMYNTTRNLEGKVRSRRSSLPAIFVETAVFVDRDLYKHMAVNYPQETERELVRFVLAMINAVQLLYHDPSLGRNVNFILKRLEILHEDPANLKRPHDIDRFLSNFCTWQRLENPPGDTDPLHWDHALILTGLDLYVVSKNGKVSSQVVGLAPVAGMCTITSSCTVNEGRHFESVYVVAHEIGHNLGMRHDGPLAENECDPSSFVMSPTLGSGKITWSPCSRRYLQTFLDTVQSRCLLDHGSSAGQLDHSAEGILPGERFDADQQCMLKYGRGSRRAPQQAAGAAACRDLHCRRDRHTFTSHPALEGTKCADDAWCRSGECVSRSLISNAQVRGNSGNSWSRWSAWAECASGCLYSEEGRLSAGSSGVMMSTRRCNKLRPENGANHCVGHDRKYQTCYAQQCVNVPKMTVREFADQICARAREVDPDLIGTGIQRTNNEEDACGVWCHTRGGGYKSRGWWLPDGTACATPMRTTRTMRMSRTTRSGRDSHAHYCIAGKCQKFVCPTSSELEFSLKQSECEWESANSVSPATSYTSEAGDTGSTDKSSFDKVLVDKPSSTGPWRRAAGSGSGWRAASGCHYHCVSPGAGLRLVRSSNTHDTSPPKQSIQLCRPDEMGCNEMKSPYQHATFVCSKYKERVRRLSGLGMQISPAIDDPDRPCRIACQDEAVTHRFYLVNGQEGWFPFGTSCSKYKTSYCISGKCLDFGPDDTPLAETEFTLPLLSRSNATLTQRLRVFRAGRHKRDTGTVKRNVRRVIKVRSARSLVRDAGAVKVKATLDQDHLDQIISMLNFSDNLQPELNNFDEVPMDQINLDFSNPIHIAPEETMYSRNGRFYMPWD